MTMILRLYRWALALYPRPFRDLFAQEMEDVFRQAAADYPPSRRLAFLLREAAGLPANLLDAYAWALRGEAQGRMALSAAGEGSLEGDGRLPRRADSLLAGLPHLLLGLLAGVPSLLIAINPKWVATGWLANLLPFLVLALALLSAAVYGRVKGWGRWSASWAVYLLAVPVIIVVDLLQAAQGSGKSTPTQVFSGYLETILLPLLLAFVLYTLTCRDRPAGLLASLAPMAVVWTYFHEFVPSLWQGLAWLWVCALAFGAAAGIVRTRRFNTILALALAVPVLGGFPNTFLGVYQGGTLPFSEPGPSLRVVMVQFLPFLALVSTLALGPLLAYKVRGLGERSAAWGGKACHRLTLGASLASLALVTGKFAVTTTGPGSSMWMIDFLTHFTALLFISGGVTLVGFALLVWAAIQSGALSGDDSAPLKLPALLACLAGLPLILLMNMPGGISPTFDSSIFPLVLALAWLAASVWVVKD